MDKPRVLALATQVDAIGGVQTVNRHIAVALNSFASARTLSLHDEAMVQVRVGEEAATVEGSSGKKARFATRAIRAARGRDLIILTHPNLASLIPYLPRGRSIVLGHGIDAWNRQTWARRRGLRMARAVGAVSRHTLDRMISVQKLSPGRTFVLPNALDPAREPTEPRVPAPQQMILTVSRLDLRDRYKGVDDTIDALVLVRRRLPGVRLHIVGDGDDRVRLERRARDLGLTGGVRFLGSISDDDLAGEYGSAHAFVLPSTEEGFGLVYVEAMAAGVPVVGCAEGATPEVVPNGRAGILVPAKDRTALAHAMEEVLDPAHGPMMGAAGQAHVAANFTFDIFRDRLEELCRSILDRAPRSGVL